MNGRATVAKIKNHNCPPSLSGRVNHMLREFLNENNIYNNTKEMKIKRNCLKFENIFIVNIMKSEKKTIMFNHHNKISYANFLLCYVGREKYLQAYFFQNEY